MTTTLRARFDGKVFVPMEDVDVPIGEIVTLQVSAERSSVVSTAKTSAQRLAEKLASYPPAGLPSDFSAQYDHYLYGTPKRDNA